jgi:hypothetical protein
VTARAPRIRKPNVKLTQTDFTTFPLWEYADDEEGVEGQDETWVRPVKRKSIPRGRHQIFVAADYVLASGRKLRGYAEVATLDGLEFEEAWVLHRRQTVALLSRQEPSHYYDPLGSLLKLLDMPEREVFPARYTLRVPVQGERELHRGEIASVVRQ